MVKHPHHDCFICEAEARNKVSVGFILVFDDNITYPRIGLPLDVRPFKSIP